MAEANRISQNCEKCLKPFSQNSAGSARVAAIFLQEVQKPPPPQKKLDFYDHERRRKAERAATAGSFVSFDGWFQRAGLGLAVLTVCKGQKV